MKANIEKMRYIMLKTSENHPKVEVHIRPQNGAREQRMTHAQQNLSFIFHAYSESAQCPSLYFFEIAEGRQKRSLT